MAKEKCVCGAEDCWDINDYSWLSSRSGWCGDINGCHSSIFFIHGKKIREQRHIPCGSFPISVLHKLLDKWADGLPNAQLVWSEDTGDGESGLWIEGVREPNNDDKERLAELRVLDYQKATEELKSIFKRYPELRGEI